jgi:HPt (histidine-containing phosphotransfer) domain-containing protein
MNVSHILYHEKLDTETLHSLYEDDVEHAEVVFRQFIKSVPGQMAGIETSFTENSIETFREKVHKIKPVFSFVGLSMLNEQAAALEVRCKSVNNLQELEPAYTNFKTDFSNSLPIVEEVLQKLSTDV